MTFYFSPTRKYGLASMNLRTKNLQMDASHQKKPRANHHQMLDTDLAPSFSSHSPAGDALYPHSPPSSHNISAEAVEAPEPNLRPTRGHRHEDRDGSGGQLAENRDDDEETQWSDAVGGNKDARLALGGEQAGTSL